MYKTKTTSKFILLFVICILFTGNEFIGLVKAQSADINLVVVVQPGPFYMTSPTSLDLGKIKSLSSSQIVQGKIQGVKIFDVRGIGGGWTLNVRAAHLGIAGQSARKVFIKSTYADIADFSVSGAYDGMNAQAGFSGTGSLSSGMFTIGINGVSGTPNRPTNITIIKPDQNSVTTSVTNNSVTFNGLIINFGQSQRNFSVSDEFGILVDHFPYTELHSKTDNLKDILLPPPLPTGMAANTTGNNFAGTDGTSTPVTGARADFGSGFGDFSLDNTLSWQIHSSPLVGSYQSKLTYTIQ